MKNKKIRIVRLLFLISLIFFAISIRTTYSKYQEKIGTTYSVKLKGWNIKLNNQDIAEKTCLNEILTPFWNNSDLINNYTVEGKYVPGSEQYLTIIVDYTDVDLKFDIDIEIKQTAQQRMDAFKVTGYTKGIYPDYNTIIDDSENDMLYMPSSVDENSTKTYTIHEEIDAPNVTDKIKYYRIYLGWVDDEKDGNVTINNELVEKNKYDTAYVMNGITGNTVANQVGEKTQAKISYEAVARFTQVVDE